MTAKRIVLAALAAIVALPALVGTARGFTGTAPGEVAVVRDGGWFDDTEIRQVIGPASGPTWTGLWSSVHTYPAQQRFYTITADPKRATALGVDVVTVPSSDGVNLGLEGTLYFTLTADEQALRRFDDKYGTRTYRGQDDRSLAAWDGDEGWAAFFGQAVRPVVDNALRVQVGAMRFTLAKVTLPAEVQRAVDRALAAGAAVSEARARVEQAKAEAAANRARQEGYDKCPACAEIDKLKSLPQGITVYAPGNPQSVVVPAR
ncbi:SPFH domain-containing protein [Thermoactinospora rubra]|uniref:SPFH domain-containing protein n=1 Tax=Thermoactinospora rubra TaxID=1088767 RepID=UPI000A1118AE|nr:SPFH domain-containing protein [Thermoactinospora rubra]